MSATSSGGKYTRELKLRVLEHYFRNGGDVFGNKQATSKKFGVDSKTINRFLKIHELVRMARKNAKSSGKSSSANDSFKVGVHTFDRSKFDSEVCFSVSCFHFNRSIRKLDACLGAEFKHDVRKYS